MGALDLDSTRLRHGGHAIPSFIISAEIVALPTDSERMMMMGWLLCERGDWGLEEEEEEEGWTCWG